MPPIYRLIYSLDISKCMCIYVCIYGVTEIRMQIFFVYYTYTIVVPTYIIVSYN